MRRFNVFAIFVVVLLSATLMSAQATLTWVSSVGDDANPCSRAAPCKTWAGAIAKTASGGEIHALDPSDFGALTITKSITLDGGERQAASVLVAGANGVTVAAGSTDVVIIRNLRLDGLLGNGGNASNAGLAGISFLSGKDLNIENCTILGFNTAGISASLGASASMHIINTIITNIGTCSPASCTTGQGDGIFAATRSGLVNVVVDHTQVMVTSNNGIEGGGNSRFVISRSLVSGAGSDGLRASAATAQMSIDYTDMSYNVNGAEAANGSSVNVSNSKFGYNTSCSMNNAGSTFGTYQNNRDVGVLNCGTIVPLGQQ